MKIFKFSIQKIRVNNTVILIYYHEIKKLKKQTCRRKHKQQICFLPLFSETHKKLIKMAFFVFASITFFKLGENFQIFTENFQIFSENLKVWKFENMKIWKFTTLVYDHRSYNQHVQLFCCFWFLLFGKKHKILQIDIKNAAKPYKINEDANFLCFSVVK